MALSVGSVQKVARTAMSFASKSAFPSLYWLN